MEENADPSTPVSLLAKGPSLTRLSLGIVTVLISTACTNDGIEVRERVAAIQRQAAPAEQEWQHYLGDKAASHYSPLTQINRDNVGRLQEAWRYDSGDAGDRNQTEMETNPLVIKGAKKEPTTLDALFQKFL